MFDRVQPFELKYIQKASPKEGDAFDFSLIYKFYTDKTEEYQRLKYIIRASREYRQTKSERKQGYAPFQKKYWKAPL